MLHASPNTSKSEYNFTTAISHNISQEPRFSLISEESPDKKVYTPPPHIAARIYRPKVSRRKRSSTSSRRGSLSSVNSHQSTAWHDEPKSSFVAQHQRRAFIIENRKARLADRAAHAEKVRLRAAFHKASSRSTANSEERALAVQQAREKNLAEIVAACAEEVKRAKGIAESMKEKREADGKKLRKDMEDRLAEAEKRREEILNRASNLKRSRSLNHPQKGHISYHEKQKPLSIDAAVFRIQRTWRARQSRKAIREFAEIGLTVETIAQKSFSQIASLLERNDVILITARLLRICGLKEIEIQSKKGMSAVRAFLSAYLIVGHPEQTLINKADPQNLSQEDRTLPLETNNLDNPDLQSLLAKARGMLTSFENTVSRSHSGNPVTTWPVKFPEVYAAFFESFVAWKLRDSEAILDVLILQFTEMEKIRQKFKDINEDKKIDSNKDRIRESQIMLMAKIKRLAGEDRAKKMISRALREVRSSRPRKKAASDVQIQNTKHAEPRKVSDDRFEQTERVMAAALHTLTDPLPPENNESPFINAIRFSQPIMHENRIVSHEIAINKEYRIGEEILTGKNVLMQSAFNNMRKSIATGNSEVWVLAMAENVRTKLQRLLAEGKPTHVSVGEWLDHDHISTQLQNGSFSYDKFFDQMAELLPKLCAPFRDKEIKAITREKFRESDVVSRLEALIYALDILQLDYANFILQQQIPMILANAAEYESYHFMHQLAQGKCSLRATENAWRLARTKALTEISRRDPDHTYLHRNKLTAEKIYTQMLVDVFTFREDESEIPETLQLDKHRIFRIRDELFRIVTCGAILLQCKNLLKRDVRSLWKIEANRVYLVLENTKSFDQVRLGIQAALENSRSMPMVTRDNIRNLVDHTITASNSTKQLNDPVLLLLMNRLRSHILHRISARSEKEKVKSAANENLVTLGLPEFSQKISDIVQEIGRVAAVDREAHKKWYEQIIHKLDAQQIDKSEKMDVDGFSAL